MKAEENKKRMRAIAEVVALRYLTFAKEPLRTEGSLEDVPGSCGLLTTLEPNDGRRWSYVQWHPNEPLEGQ